MGLGEAGVTLAKLSSRQGDQAAAAAHITAAVGHYSECHGQLLHSACCAVQNPDGWHVLLVVLKGCGEDAGTVHASWVSDAAGLIGGVPM